MRVAKKPPSIGQRLRLFKINFACFWSDFPSFPFEKVFLLGWGGGCLGALLARWWSRHDALVVLQYTIRRGNKRVGLRHGGRHPQDYGKRRRYFKNEIQPHSAASDQTRISLLVNQNCELAWQLFLLRLAIVPVDMLLTMACTCHKYFCEHFHRL